MYDGVTVASWPEGVRYGLVYTDGHYANMTAAKARFPNIYLQTISAVGLVPADWVDCEPGCVWPPAAAVALYQQWRVHGCRGVYCNQSTKPAVKAAAVEAGVTLELFGSDPTGVPHINSDESQTQFMFTAGYDVTAFPVPVAPAPRPGPAPTSTPTDPPGGLTLTDISDASVARIVAGVQLMLRQEMAGDPNEIYGRVMQACVEAIRHEAATIEADVKAAQPPHSP